MRAIGGAGERTARRGVNDGAHAGILHARRDGACRYEGAGQVDAQHAVPFLELHVERAGTGEDAGVVDEPVGLAPLAFEGRDRFLDLVGIADVKCISSRDRALTLAELRGLLNGIFQNIPERDARARGGEPQRHGAANALRRAGDDDFRRQHHDDSPQTAGTAGLARSSTPQSLITGSIASRPYACHISAASANTTLVPRSRSSMSMAGGASHPPPLM
jgi:hypothetical protein